jgi:ABC-type nitrate/sulfonate/bicarbonate transport system substrate-binding protein
MSRVTAFAAALLLALTGLARSGTAAEAALVLQLHAPASFRFAGYYAALWQGFYKAEGLSIEIRPGAERSQPAVDPVREIADGHAQLGTGTAQLVIRAAQGLPIVVLAQIFQRSGAAIYYRSDGDFSSPATLAKAKLGRLPASDILDIELATALRAEGIDASKLKSVPIEPGQAAAALADRSIDVAIGTPWTIPWEAYERGFTVKSFNPANYRVEFYGDSLFTLERIATTDPQTVQRFRSASLKGWEYALQHPAEIESRLIAEHPSPLPVSDTTGFLHYQGDVAQRLARYPDIQLGYANIERWTQIETAMRGVGALSRNADLAGFLYDADLPPPRPDNIKTWRLAGGIAAVFVALLAIGTWLVRRRPPARVAKTQPPPPAVTPPIAGALVRRPAAALPAPTAPGPAPPAPPLPAPIDLNAVLTPLERAIRRRVRGKVRCRLSLLPELWRCRVEPAPVAAIVLDLVQAAVDVTDADGSLIVGTRNFIFDDDNIADYPGGRIGEFARITVRDSGPGLSDAEFDQILDPEKTARPALARAGEAMHGLGGFARVESAVGVGTAVHLYFARVDERAERKADEAKPTAAVAE